MSSSGGTSVVAISPSGDTTGAKDTAAFATALTAARLNGSGTVKGVPGSTYYLTGVVLGSNVTLDMSDCVVIQVAGTNTSLITNYAQTATATGTATMTQYSTTVTTALASVAVVGQTIVINNAAGSGATPLTGLVASVNTGAGTLTIENLDTSYLQSSAAVTNQTCTLYTRDSNIRIVGGFYEFGANSSGTNIPSDNHILLRHIDTYYVDLQGASSSAKGYVVSVADCTKGWGRLRNLATTSLNGDGWHVNGPHYGLVIDEISGATGDDAFGITGSDYPSQCDTSGNVKGVVVRYIDAASGDRSAIVNAGVGNTVDDIRFIEITGTAQGTAGAVLIGDDTSQANTIGGSYGYIDFGTISAIPVNATNVLGIISPKCNYLKATIDFLQGSYAYSVTTGASITGTSTVVIDTLDLTATINAAASGTAVPLAMTSTSTTINSTFMNGKVWNGTAWLSFYSNPAANTELLSSGEQTISRYLASQTGITPTSGDAQFTFFTAKKTHIVTSITFPTAATGSAGLTAGYVGLYSVSGTTFTRIAVSANTTTLMNGTYGTSSVTIPATTLIAGTQYAVAILMVGTTMPTMTGQYGVRPIAVAPYLSGKLTGQTTLPTSTTQAALSSNGGQQMYAELTP